MPSVLITSTMKSEPGRETKALPRMLAAPSERAGLDSAACATLVAAAIAAAVAAPAAAAPFRKLRRSSPDSSWGVCVGVLRALAIGVSACGFYLREHLSKTGRGKTVPGGAAQPVFRQMETARPAAAGSVGA